MEECGHMTGKEGTFYFSVSSLVLVSIEKSSIISNTKTVFDHILKHREES